MYTTYCQVSPKKAQAPIRLRGTDVAACCNSTFQAFPLHLPYLPYMPPPRQTPAYAHGMPRGGGYEQ